MIGIRVTNCWGESFCISNSYLPPTHVFQRAHAAAQWGHMRQFLSSFCVDYFLATLSDIELQVLCHHFSTDGQLNRPFLEQALLNGQLIVHPEIPHTDLSPEESNRSSHSIALPAERSPKAQAQTRSVIMIRADIKVTLRQILDQERIETQQLEQQYQQKSDFEKNMAHLKHFAKGLHSSGASFLIWLKDVHDVINMNQRLLRIIKAAMAAEQDNQGQRYQVFKQTLAESEKKELVEALGFDPAQISVEKLKQVYSLANVIYEDPLTCIILTQFVKDYVDAQHSLEWSEFSGGAAFEVILTALLALATGGAGALVSLGTQARKMSQLKKLGALLSELAEQLKDIPKEKPVSLRQLKEVEDKKGQKAQKPANKPAPEPSPEPEKVDSAVAGDDGRIRGEEVVADKPNAFTSVDDFNRAANNPSPNTSYSYGNYTWMTDDLSRVSRIEGQATLQKHGRHVTPGEPDTVAIGKEGGFEDVGFHFVGDQFNGPINKLNVVPGSGRSKTLSNGDVLKNLNLSRYKTDFEHPVASIYRETGNPVPISIEAVYKRNNTTLRPDGFRASYQKPDGTWENVMFKNKAGG